MVIVHLVAPGEFGGLERVVQMLCKGLSGLGHEVHVVAVAADQKTVDPFLTPLANAGVHTHALGVPGRAYRSERAAIRDLCRRVCPDVVHTHGYRPDVLDAGVVRRLGIPVVTTVHGFTGGGWKNRFYEWLQCRAFRRFDAVVAVSRPLVQRLIRAGVHQSRVYCLPNAWDQIASPIDRESARRALDVPRDAYVIGWVGRLSHEKGPDVLLDALRYAGDMPLVAAVVGSGDMLTALQSQANEIGLNGRVRWHGSVPDAARLFPAFDLCVLSSRTEGTPIVLLEAMAAGVPIVATRVGGVPDMVSPAEGVLVPPNDPIALAAEIRRAWADPAAAARRASAARARLERDFGVAPWLDRYETVYRLVRKRVASPAPAAA
jgi:glycosyltransferase involved in cell wall biosynthesis